jgi:hypothetical protein
MTEPASPSPEREMARNQAEADIDSFKRHVESATVEEVDEPTGCKQVEIAFSSAEQGFRMEEGEAYGVYFEPERGSPERIHVDWVTQSPKGSEQKSRTTVEWEDVESFEEGEYE